MVIDMSEFLHSNGDYRTLLSYRLAQKISVVTEIFVERFLQRGSRTVDQMQQAARSCKQNIVEGSAAAITSKETEIKLTNVARASLCELQEDYEDYLAFRGLKPWSKEHPRIQRLRAYVRSDGFDGEYMELCRRLPAEEFCNLALTLIIQTEYLLDKMLVAQQRRFLESGGIREAMSAGRRDYRQRQENQNNQNNWNNKSNQNNRNNRSNQNNSNDSNSSNNSNSSNSSNNPNPPLCPKCGRPMLRRKQKKAQTPGREFWGCSDYPNCNGLLPIDKRVGGGY